MNSRTEPRGHISIMARLKSDTAALHERAESVVPVMRDDLDILRYADVLARFVALYGPLEDALAGSDVHAELGIDLDARRKAPALRSDLRALCDRGILAPRHYVKGAAPPLRDANDALGILYVLEGATLGGTITFRHIAARLGLSPTAGGAFYSIYGDRLGAMWREFGEAAERHVARSPGGADAIVEAARATFLAVIQQFE